MCVSVLRCETIQPHIGGYTQCLPANSRIYGTTCRVSCYKGYNLTGPSDFECTENGYWSIEPVPSCQSKFSHISETRFIIISVTQITNNSKQTFN